MEQRKRTPTGTFKAEELRKRLHSAEYTVVGKHPPPTPPALQPIHAALDTLGDRVGEQVECQHDVATALRQLTARFNEVERFVVRSTTYYHEQAGVLYDKHTQLVGAVRQVNQVHEQGNGLSSVVYGRLGEITSHLEHLTRAYRENTVVRQQAARSWTVRAVYSFNQHRTSALVGTIAFAACLLAFRLADYLLH